jgi:RNA-directed DNA polymerase
MLTDECPRGRRWVVETDIASCFPAIPHEQLMEAVEELLRRDRLGGLIREYA